MDYRRHTEAWQRVRPGNCFIYAARLGERIKVGSTGDLLRRMSELAHQNVGEPEFIGALASTHETRWADETAWHQRLSAWRIKGTREWYGIDCRPALAEFTLP